MTDAVLVLRTYPALLRGAVAVTLAYRAQLLIWIIGGIFPLILLTVWLSVVAERGPAAGWTREDFISYYVASAVVFQIVNTHLIWPWDRDLRSGDLSFRLLRPISPIHHYIADEIGHRAVRLTALVPMFVIAAWSFAAIRYPGGPGGAVLAVLAVLAGFALSVAMALTFAMIAFWSTQVSNLYMLWWGGGAFLSGLIAPVPLLPEPLRTLAVFSPFRSTIDFPLQLALGRLGAGEIVGGFAVTAAWLTGFILLQRVLWRHGVSRYQAVGG